jgi:alpha-beta hydrolase superfamily lysophospholipase
MTDKISGLSINGIITGGKVKELNTSELKAYKDNLQDGRDQVYVEANGRHYVIEGENLNLSGLKKGNNTANIKLFVDDKPVAAKIEHIDNEYTTVKENISVSSFVPKEWGNTPAQIQGTLDDIADIKGNNDLLWDNETKPAGTVNNLSYKNPILLRERKNFEGGLDIEGKINGLKSFRAEKEVLWGQRVTSLDLNTLKEGELFAVQKAVTLTRMERTPADVTEGFVKAAGSINGHKIADREIFWQRFKPIGEASGKVIMIAPGFLQTGRNFNEQVLLLNKQGHDVIVMDQQWAGQTKGGKAGGVDRGYGISRDVAVMASFAQKTLDNDYKNNPEKEVILMGTSLGGGPGVLGAMTMNENGLVKLEGETMPKGLRAVLQAPFMGSTSSVLNKTTSAGSHVPLAKDLTLPSLGIPVISADDKANQKLSQGAVLEDVGAKLQAMTAMMPDVKEMLKMIDDGKGPKNSISIVHAKDDPLADSGRSELLAQKLPNVKTHIFASKNHVFEQDTEEQGLAVDALSEMIKGK